MSLKKPVYEFDSSTGEYKGPYMAQEDPMEEGKYVEPVYSTEIAPPALSANQVAVFVSGSWTKSPDFRGQTWYDQATGAAVEIIDIGQPASNLAATPPPLTTAQRIQSYESAAQSVLDGVARSWGYDSLMSATSYINSTVAKFKTEASALSGWRDSFWTSAYDIEINVEQGAQALPSTAADFVALLPPPPTRPV